jgi:hypothetical protein
MCQRLFAQVVPKRSLQPVVIAIIDSSRALTHVSPRSAAKISPRSAAERELPAMRCVSQE